MFNSTIRLTNVGTNMEWKVRYYNGSLPLDVITSDECGWDDLPKSGVVDVTVTDGKYSHTLQGMDYYWIDGNTYGMFNDDSNFDIYEGEQAVAYEFSDNGHVKLKYAYTPNHILEGVMLPDNVAQEIGLL